MYEQGEHLYLVTGTAKETVRDGLLCSAIEKPVQVAFQQQPLSWKPINKQTDKKNQRRLKSRYISRGAISKQRVQQGSQTALWDKFFEFILTTHNNNEINMD